MLYHNKYCLLYFVHTRRYCYRLILFDKVLQPKGVGVIVEARHQCMTTRGVHKTGVSMVTSQMIGSFRKDARTRIEFLRMIDANH